MSRIALVSIAPTEIRVSRGAFVTLSFPPCTNGRKYSVDYCEDRTEYRSIHITATEVEHVPIPIKGEEVMRDLMVNEWLDREGIVASKQPCQCTHHLDAHQSQGQSNSLYRPCTVPGCECKDIVVVPTEQELGEAYAQRQRWLETYIQLGDTEYSRTKRVDLVPEQCKRAVRELGLRRDYVFTPEGPQPVPVQTHECQGCGTKINFLSDNTLPATCRVCHNILDEAKAIKLGLVKPEMVTVAPVPVVVTVPATVGVSSQQVQQHGQQGIKSKDR